VFLLVPAYPGCPGPKAVNGFVCVYNKLHGEKIFVGQVMSQPSPEYATETVLR